MDINQAKNLKPGQRVSCPADRGDPAFTGTVELVGETVYTSHSGVEYVWVNVRRSSSVAGGVWPSNRLG